MYSIYLNHKLFALMKEIIKCIYYNLIMNYEIEKIYIK